MSVCLSVCPSVCPSLRMEQFNSQSTAFHIFRNSFEGIEIWLRFYTSIVYFAWRPTRTFMTSRLILLIMRNVSDISCRENQNTPFFKFFFPKIVPCRRICVKARYSQLTTDDNAMRGTLFACWIPEAIDTHSEYVILIFSHCNNGLSNTP
jgi:hypothetical protein